MAPAGDNPCVLASSAAYPVHSYSQDEVLDAVSRQNGFSEDDVRFGKRMFEATMIQKGNISLPPQDLGRRMDRKTYRAYLHSSLKALSLDACRDAMRAWGGKQSEITHLIWATMSAVVDVPSMDCVLVNELGLNASVNRLAVQQMGCLSGFRCLNLAAELTRSNPAARVLVCVADIRSGLQNQLPTNPDGTYSKSALLSCALFRDAASAVIVGSRVRPSERPVAEWLQGASHIIKGTLDQVTSTDSNDAEILWYSDRKLPACVGADTPQVIKQLVAGLDFEIAACDTQFVVHTGGPAILKGTQEVLGLPDDQMQASWDFMENHGNTSGSSNLAILHHELTRSQPVPRNYIVCLAGGPGVCIEGALLKRLCSSPKSGSLLKSELQPITPCAAVTVSAP